MGAETNFTVTVPVGTSNHGDPHLVCTPAKWYDYILFFSLNYFIHAATVPSVPGETLPETVYTVVNALFVPGFGVTRAIRRLVLRPRLNPKHPLDCALKAGALAMVVRGDSGDRPPDHWTYKTFTDTSELTQVQIPRTRTIHGRCGLPQGYSLYIVPTGAKLAPVLSPRSTMEGEPKAGSFSKPANQTSAVKVLFSLAQAVAGGVAIYRARGDQIQQYGYGAFGLSVVPYVFMSVVNLTALLLGPEFPSMYLVRTPDMGEAERQGGDFEGIIATLVTPEDDSDGLTERVCVAWDGQASDFLWLSIFYLVLMAAPVCIVGGLSGFRPGDSSTAAQRGWILSWLIVGSISSVFIALFRTSLSETELGFFFFLLFLTIPFWIPALGGMVMVGLELREYGICSRLS
ncbi:hypothetical protein B0T18DRAFT_407326 [Schizothecium vesticola]|uniref:Uncharacterized protein n=1 Tax=Schizothecium vesticola TaxID=314040 RepID=A0AA40F294_9PEZI|nr:hypothetical protein B0T18DRAFT_407326 [Schizothecium vesticola]